MAQERFLAKVERAVENGAVSKACSLLVSDGVHDAGNSDILDALRRLHPED